MWQIGLILKAWITKFLRKVAQISIDFLGYFEKLNYLGKNCIDYFWGNVPKYLAILYFIIDL